MAPRRPGTYVQFLRPLVFGYKHSYQAGSYGVCTEEGLEYLKEIAPRKFVIADPPVNASGAFVDGIEVNDFVIPEPSVDTPLASPLDAFPDSIRDILVMNTVQTAPEILELGELGLHEIGINKVAARKLVVVAETWLEDHELDGTQKPVEVRAKAKSKRKSKAKTAAAKKADAAESEAKTDTAKSEAKTDTAKSDE